MENVFMIGVNVFMVAFTILVLPIIIKDLVDAFREDKCISTKILSVFLIVFLIFITVFYYLFVVFNKY